MTASATLTLGTLRLLPHGQWEIDARPHVMMRLRRIFSRSRAARSKIVIDHTPEVARDLEWIIDRWPLEITDDDLAALTGAADRHRATEEAVAAILSGGRSLTGDAWREPTVEPRDYQLQASNVVLTTGRLLVADALGLGKTFTGLLTLREPASTPALIVAPPHLVGQWEEQCHRFFPLLRTHVIRTTKPYDPSRRREMRGYDPDVLITTYNKLAGWRDHLAGQVQTVIFDEAHELRRHESAKYAAAEHIAAGARYRAGLTATPVFNYGGDVYNIVGILDPTALGSRSEFNAEWCHTDGRGNAIVHDPAALGAYLRETGLMVRRTRADVGRELPPVQRITQPIDTFSDPLKAVAADVRGLAETILQSTDHEAVWRAKGELDWKLREATGIAKAPHISQFVRDLLETEDKVVVFLWHREVYSQVLADLQDHDIEAAMYTGSESPAQKAKAKHSFIDGDVRVLLMSLRSGAGLDGLQAVCSTCVFGELDWSPSQHDQCVGRFNRDGQTGPVSAFFLLAESGSDPVVAETLGLKRQQADGIHDPDAQLFNPTDEEIDRFRALATAVMEGA